MATKLKHGASAAPGVVASIVNESGIEIKTLYSADDLENGQDAGEDRIGKPGEYPFTRGIHAEMYRRRPWTMRQYTGFGNAHATNERFHYLIENGQTGLNVAFDLPTHIDKRLILEESLRMPLIIRYPGVVEAGSVNDDIVLNVDFAETLLEISGLPVPKVMQGRSFLPLLKGETPTNWRTSSFYAYWGGATKHYGVRTRRHKLALHHTGERDLFDLEKDPLERRSEISNPEYAGVLRELERELERLKKEVGIADDQLPGKRQ